MSRRAVQYHDRRHSRKIAGFGKSLANGHFVSYSKSMKIGIAAAKTQLPALIRRAQSGERILITRNGHIVARLRGYRRRETDEEWVTRLIGNLSTIATDRKRGNRGFQQSDIETAI